MDRTYQHALPLVQAGQAQKHVTVNEALARLDAVSQLRVVSTALGVPPISAVDGQAYLVPAGASGEWSGHTDELALFSNGGWVFLEPRPGWRAWDETTGRALQFDGGDWRADAVAISDGGAATLHRIVQVDHVLDSGAISVVAGVLPANSVVFGVTARVIQAIGGSATGWSLGVAGSENRYGSGLGMASGSYALGLTGSPVTYYADTDLILTGEGGGLSGGTVRLAVHLISLEPPRFP